ncbi:MAG TPA: lantibiotic dehydratase family protein, partial [Flavisolibacter sp.]
MKNLFKEWYQPQEEFVVRNPLFPIEQIFKWRADTEAGAEQSKQVLVEQLRQFYLTPIVQEAVYVASPDLYEQLLLWLGGKIDRRERKEKLELSLVKYMIRMSTRCTPYGLFASCTVGRFSDTTQFKMGDKELLERHGRLDMEYVCQLHGHLLKEPEIRDQLLFFPNTSLYRIGDSWRYLEHRMLKEFGRSYHLVDIGHSDYLENLLLVAKEGARITDLAKVIADDMVSIDKAVDFVYELVDSQVLVDEMQPFLTGQEYFSILLSKISSLRQTEKYTEQLVTIAGQFKELGKTGGIDRFKHYGEISRCIEELGIPLTAKIHLQVDGYRRGMCDLNRKVSEEVLRGASVLQILTAASISKDPFAEFKTSFTTRYEGRWVPLNEVLDSEAGIGYGKFANAGLEESPLIANLAFSNEAKPELVQEPELFKWQMCVEAINHHKKEVVIDDSLLEALSLQPFSADSLPDSISIMVKISASEEEEIDKGNYDIILQPPFGPSGGNLLSRFCHLNQDMEKLVRSLLETEEEQNKDAVFAEVVHLPESRVGNILLRPRLRKYEIPYLCGSGLEKEFQIDVNDLLVGIEKNKIVLFSKRLNKEVVPRLTTAHNYHSTTVPLYRFLCDLQFQNIRTIGWQWGILESLPFLPRVRYGRFIFSKARWRLTKEDMYRVVAKGTESDFFDEF